MKVLLVEDDLYTSELLSAALTSHGYIIDRALDGQTGLDLASLWDYDLILLDIELPKLSGLEICQTLRSQGYSTPILMLTVHDSGEAMIQGLDMGADDYIIKPCDPSQLLARIRALLRRGKTVAPSNLLIWGSLCLNPASAQVTYGSTMITLSPKEYSLLELFLRHPQQIFSRATIIDRLWSLDTPPSDKAVTNLVKDLRRKLRTAGVLEEWLETVYGFGYRLMPYPEPGPFPAQPSIAHSSPSPELPQQWLEGAYHLAARFKNSLERRITVLEEAIQALQTQSLSGDRRQQAKEEAHRLAGGLGTFHYEAGSTIARAIEYLLAGDSPLPPNQIELLVQLLNDLKRAIANP